MLLGEVLAEPDGDPDDDSDEVTSQPHERLHNHWEAHFAYKPIETWLAQALTRRCGASMIEVGPLPTAKHFQGCLRRCKRSAPGPDGIPHLAWRAAGRLGCHVLARALHALLAGGSPSPTLNSMYLVCIPNGLRPEEGAFVARAASQTRPLVTEVKLMAPCVARSTNQGLEARVPDRQRGFLRGRLATDNIAELDASGRIAALRTGTDFSDPERLPLLWALDIRAAFPTLARPSMKATWRRNEAAIVAALVEAAPVSTMAGVTQGCRGPHAALTSSRPLRTMSGLSAVLWPPFSLSHRPWK